MVRKLEKNAAVARPAKQASGGWGNRHFLLRTSPASPAS